MWTIILIIPFLILGWLLLAPLHLQIDTRIPEISLRWFSIGKAKLVYEQDKWRLKISVLFILKQWDLQNLVFKQKKRVQKTKKVKKKNRPYKQLRKFVSLVKTFRITKWQIAIDMDDEVKNAWLYPLNFYPATRHHLYVNYCDKNYLFLEIRNTPWKMVYAFIR